MLMKTANFGIFIFLIIFSPFYLFSQTSNEWSYVVEPYIMFPNMSGATAIGNLPELNVEVSSDQIFNNLKMGAMLYLEASNEKWNFNSDLLYMDLAKGVKSNIVINNGEVTAKQVGWELAGLYKVKPWLQVGIGSLLNSITVAMDINRNAIGGGTTNITKERCETWVDPMIIVAFKSTSERKFIYSLRSEIGGFGVGSQLAWQMQGYAGYRFSKLFQIQGGYRIISLDYEKGSGADYFLYDIDTFGPVVRFGFNF